MYQPAGRTLAQPCHSLNTNDFHSLSLRPDKRVYPSITPETREGLHGCVEEIGPAGIRGWLLDCAACDTHLKVDAYLDEQFLGNGYAVRHRTDISQIMGRPIHCEFLLPWEPATLLAELKTLERTKPLRIRVLAAESGREIAAIGEDSLTVGQLLDFVKATPASAPQGFQREKLVQSFATAEDSTPEVDGDVRAIAFYLPQFHPIPENDAWWGKGFTEWSNVASAKPQFAGHHQPQLPGELGFYDLRIDEVREQQARLAREHGLYGFCYYYYWFNGRRILEKPLQMMLDAGTPDFPFCICWANENWTRRWDGLESDLLLQQEHNEASDLAFIKDVLPILKDPRYIRVKGAPLLLIYRAHLLPDPVRTSAVWRQVCKEAGLDAIHLCAVETPGTPDPYSIGFDSAAQFPPHKLQTSRAEDTVTDLNPHFTGSIHDYEWTVAEEINAPTAPYRRFRGVMTSWDNTARRGSASHIFVNSHPEAYEVWLRGVVDATKRDLPPGERLLFINAWNEWAEGAHLEPDTRFGRGYLEATRRALTGTSTWDTLVEYARGRQEMSGAVLTDWLSDVGALMSSQQRSLEYLTRIHRRRMFHGHTESIVFSTANPHHHLSERLLHEGHGRLDHVNEHEHPRHVKVTRSAPLYLNGWAFVDGVNLGPATRTTLVMENEVTAERYYATLSERSERHDAAACFPATPASSTAFSGFSAYADIRQIREGVYRTGIIHERDQQAIQFTFVPRIQLV